jgi:Predicted membrane protein (DUF2079)
VGTREGRESRLQYLIECREHREDPVPQRELSVARRPGRKAGWCIVALGVLVFAGLVTAENRIRYLTLNSTYPTDLGSFHNQAFNIAQGRDITYLFMGAWFAGGDSDGPSVYRSAHFTPLRVRVLPLLYRLWPRIETAMFLQGLLIGIGALALYGFALDRTGSPACGLVLAASYLLHPALLQTAANDLREITLGIGPALLALWFHSRRRHTAFVLAALVALAARSEYVLLVAAIGLVNVRLVPRRSLPASLGLPIAVGLGWAGLAEAYYQYFYRVHWPLVAMASGEPLSAALGRWLSRLVPFFELTLLPGFAALGAPEALALAMPFVVFAKRVHAIQFPPHHLQHLAPAMVAVFWGFAITLTLLWNGRLRRYHTAIVGVAVSCALVGFGVFSVAAWRAYPRDTRAFSRLGRWADELPADATVVVHGSLAARFSGHTRVLDYQNLPLGPGTDASAALPSVLASADLVAVRDAPEIVARAESMGLFEGPRRFRHYVILQRRKDAAQVAAPDAVLQQALGWSAFPDWKKRGATLAAKMRP